MFDRIGPVRRIVPFFLALSEFFTILESENVDLSNPATFADPAVQDALLRAAENLEATEFEEAAENVGTWFEEECEGLGG